MITKKHRAKVVQLRTHGSAFPL